MANLSNINNKFLFTDGDFLKIGNLAPINNISGTESGLSITNSNVASIALDNTAANGKTYVMYSDDGGKLNFYDVDASSGRLVIDSSGNVGIGDASPDSTLSLQNSQSTAANNTTTGSIFQALSPNSGIFMRNRGASAGIGGSSYSTQLFTDSGAGNFEIYNISSTFSLVFGTNATERMRVTSGGNVGINYTGPFNQISGTETTLAISNSNVPSLYLNNTSTNGHNHILLSGTDGAFAIYDKTVGANRFIIDSSGSVTVNSGNVQLVDSNKRITVDGSDIRIWQRSAADIQFLTNDLERMRIDSSGNSTFAGAITISKTSSADLRLHSSTYSADFQLISGATGANKFGIYDNNGGAYRLIIDSSGNVGIGTTEPDEKLVLYKDIGYSSDSALFSAYAVNSSAVDNNKVFKWRTGITGNQSGHNLTFSTLARTESSYVERMRITSGGSVVFGGGTFSSGSNKIQIAQSSEAGYIQTSANVTTATDQRYFYNPNGLVGRIQTSGSSTSYVTSSDYRLKENVVEMTGALDRVSQLKPSRFNFIADADKTVDGFLAHEVQEIVPEAITGEKDAVDEEGNPDYQGIDQSKLVPLLVGAIQELKAEIDELKK